MIHTCKVAITFLCIDAANAAVLAHNIATLTRNNLLAWRTSAATINSGLVQILMNWRLTCRTNVKQQTRARAHLQAIVARRTFSRANAATVDADLARVLLFVGTLIRASRTMRAAAIDALLVAILNLVGARRRLETLLIDCPAVKVLKRLACRASTKCCFIAICYECDVMM
jgi:hypothetical protein